jgi:hypothetical protein
VIFNSDGFDQARTPASAIGKNALRAIIGQL